MSDKEDVKEVSLPATAEEKPKSRRGFASLDPKRQKAIASLGGKKAHQNGTGHEFSYEEASLAGKKGGATVSKDRAHMAAIGRAGGLARARRRREETQRTADAVREEKKP